jgi:hypothetical protein
MNVRYLAASLLLLTGCGGGPDLVSVSGEVTYDGAPVAEGQIVFADVDGVAPTSHAPIASGKYKIETPAGAKKVRITATKETGKILEGAMGAEVPELVDLIPAKYNTATTLSAEIAADRLDPLNFHLAK